MAHVAALVVPPDVGVLAGLFSVGVSRNALEPRFVPLLLPFVQVS